MKNKIPRAKGGRWAARRKRSARKRIGSYPSGWSHGYEMGRREAVIRVVPPDNGILFEKRILYVTTGLGIPYSPLDSAIIQELGGLVREFRAVAPSAPVVQIAEQMRPDLVLVLNGCVFFSVDQVDAIRSLGIPTAVWLTDDPYYTDMTDSVAVHYDFIFTLELSCVSFYRELGCQSVHYLPLGVNPNVFRPKHVFARNRTDICFIGSAYWNRVHVFDRIAGYLANKNVVISGWWWNRLKSYRQLRRKIHAGKWMTPEATALYYNAAKIVINLHRAHDDETWNYNRRKIPAYSVNPRTFEISGCGAFQLTDFRQDLGSVYTPGLEIAVYSTPGELKDKLEYYLRHENERREIALRGLHRTMKEHTYRRRLIHLLETVFGRTSPEEQSTDSGFAETETGQINPGGDDDGSQQAAKSSLG